MAKTEKLKLKPKEAKLRDAFAARALEGLAPLGVSQPGRQALNLDLLAATAYRLADAMLKAREAKQPRQRRKATRHHR
jgi:hypothetical protein